MDISKPKVLIVDDKEANLYALETILRGLNVEIIKAKSGNEALWMTVEYDFALILLDVQMPEMDGYEVAKVLGQEERTKHIPIIFITAIDRNDTYEVKGYENGAVDFMFKPLNEDILISKVKVFIDLYNKRSELENEIIERKKAQEKVRHLAQKALEASKAKSEFLANMSHEIRTPMNAIIGFSDILSEEQLTEGQMKYVNTIRESSKMLLELINDILDFSKMEAGKLKLEIIECSLEEILRGIESVISQTAKNKGLSFEVIHENKLPMIIKTDPVRVHQCLMNLVSNAIKFTDSGHVNIRVELEQKHNKNYIRYTIEDTGIGIAKEHLESIFNEFEQGDGSTTRKFGGTGLGLAITKRLVEMMGGSITVESKVNKGSSFSFAIPTEVCKNYDDTKDHIDDQKKKIAEHSLSGKVLVAEDSSTNQTLIKLLLNKLGLEVEIAKDGVEAVEKGTKDNYDLILMDIQMPKLNGYEATRALRDKGVDIPIIALTANAMKEDEKKCLSCGCDDYVSKPINRDKLSELLSGYLNPKKTLQDTRG